MYLYRELTSFLMEPQTDRLLNYGAILAATREPNKRRAPLLLAYIATCGVKVKVSALGCKAVRL